VSPERLDSTSSTFAAMTCDQIEAVEAIVNEQVIRNTPVHTEVRSTEEAMPLAPWRFGE
jgi:alanyl-tRNA synthetase